MRPRPFQALLAHSLLILLWTFCPNKAQAHDSGASYSTIVIFDGEASYRLEIDPGALNSAKMEQKLGLDPLFTSLSLKTKQGPCEKRLIDREKAEDVLVLRVSFLCPQKEQHFSFEAKFVDLLPPWHRHIFKAEDPSGAVVQQAILKKDSSSLDFDVEPAGAFSVVRAFVVLGVEHILVGYDHILFLLGLLIVAQSLRGVLGLVTAFTLAHSVTLVLATVLKNPHSATVAIESALGIGLAAILYEYTPGKKKNQILRVALSVLAGAMVFFGFFLAGHLRHPIKVVEITIAASVVFVGIENFFLDRKRRRWVLAFSFGLIHGFGFASVLSELHLPTTHLVTSLLSFNVGVELGQVVLIGLTFPLIAKLTRNNDKGQKWIRAMSGLIVTGGVFFLLAQLAG